MGPAAHSSHCCPCPQPGAQHSEGLLLLPCTLLCALCEIKLIIISSAVLQGLYENPVLPEPRFNSAPGARGHRKLLLLNNSECWQQPLEFFVV